MQIIVTRNVMINGKPYAPGAALDVDERVARYLKAIGKVEIVTAQAKEKATSRAAEKREKR